MKNELKFGLHCTDSLCVHSSVSRSSDSMTLDKALGLAAAWHTVIRHKTAYIHHS
jgi:hypothetical protein